MWDFSIKYPILFYFFCSFFFKISDLIKVNKFSHFLKINTLLKITFLTNSSWGREVISLFLIFEKLNLDI